MLQQGDLIDEPSTLIRNQYVRRQLNPISKLKFSPNASRPAAKAGTYPFFTNQVLKQFKIEKAFPGPKKIIRTSPNRKDQPKSKMSHFDVEKLRKMIEFGQSPSDIEQNNLKIKIHDLINFEKESKIQSQNQKYRYTPLQTVKNYENLRAQTRSREPYFTEDDCKISDPSINFTFSKSYNRNQTPLVTVA